jgi:hypothetical protein
MNTAINAAARPVPAPGNLAQTPRISLNHSYAGIGYTSLVVHAQEPFMRRMNFEQTSPASREVGGASGSMLLLVAIAICVAWAFLIHAPQ